MPKNYYIFRSSLILFKRFELFASIFGKVAIEVDEGRISIELSLLLDKYGAHTYALLAHWQIICFSEAKLRRLFSTGLANLAKKNGFFGHFAVFANSCKIVHSAPSEALLRLKQQWQITLFFGIFRQWHPQWQVGIFSLILRLSFAVRL